VNDSDGGAVDDTHDDHEGILIERPAGSAPGPGGAGSARPRNRPERVVAAVLVGVLAVGLVVAGALRLAGGPDTGAAPQRADSEHRAGECLTGDEHGASDVLALPAAAGRTRAVPCDQPHLIELTGAVPLPEEPATLRAEDWPALVEARCTPPAERYLGGPLDPDGRYRVSVLAPDPEAWRAGDKDLWCGLSANWLDPALAATPPPSDNTNRRRPPTAFTGSVKDGPQFWSYRPGDCVGPLSRAVVPCTRPHEYEVTGELTLPDRDQPPAETGEGSWDDVVGEPCGARAAAYLGHEPAAPWSAGWVPVSAGSWAAGKRTVTCMVGQFVNGEWAAVTTPAPH
jgi:hypothetical protein